MIGGSPHQTNNFDALRLFAAVMVVLGHCYVLSGRAAEEPLVRYTGLGGLGELGVSIFFVISGFLVTASFEAVGNTAAYLANRCLRILPGLAAAVLVTALALGPLVSILSPSAYFAAPETWLYPIRNLLLYPVTYSLPGVFLDNPYRGAVNGSLWTLRLEFSFYLLLPLLAWRRLLAPKALAVIAGCAAAAYWILLGLGPRVPGTALIAARNGYLFLAGAALFAWGGRVRLSDPRLILPLAALFLLAAPFEGAAPFVAPVILPALVTALAFGPLGGAAGSPPFGDLSYGLYIYAFPVQQAWMHFLGPERLGVTAFFAATLVCAAPLALASWWLVERPCLAWKGVVRARLSRFDRPRATAGALGGL